MTELMPMRVQPSSFDGQFLLVANNGSPASSPGPDGLPDADVHTLPSMRLEVVAPLDVTRVFDATGREIGALLGTPIDYRRGQMITQRLDLPVALGSDPDAVIEEHIYRLGGSWLFVLDAAPFARVYLDACGSLSAVYDPETRRVAATSLCLLTPEEAEDRFETDMFEALKVIRDGWFPAGLTAHRGIRRLMPNFYLDVTSFETRRHWPRDPIPRADDPAEACAIILESTRQTIRTIAAHHPVSQALTAGNETRMLLAAIRGDYTNIEFVTVAAKAAGLDLDRAKELAARFNLPHRIIPLQQGDAAQAADWFARVGYCIGGPHINTHPTINALENRRYFIGGLGGEIGRAFSWRESDTDDTPATAEGVWARMGMPMERRALEAVSEWLPSVEDLPGLLQLDLAYTELRMGCWGFALSYGNARPIDIHPLISRESFAAMLSLPPEWRRMAAGSNRMIGEVITQDWPELMDLPISRYGDWRDQWGTIRRAIENPYLIVKKIRKKLS